MWSACILLFICSKGRFQKQWSSVLYANLQAHVGSHAQMYLFTKYLHSYLLYFSFNVLFYIFVSLIFSPVAYFIVFLSLITSYSKTLNFFVFYVTVKVIAKSLKIYLLSFKASITYNLFINFKYVCVYIIFIINVCMYILCVTIYMHFFLTC